jgi:Zn-finger nucleic acid-binding protein
MPLLMCPNCNASMQEVKRADVAFDCRGIWLDRGELEKIIAGARDERAAFEQDRSQFYQDPDAYRRSHPQPQHSYGERGEQGERGERGAYDLHGRKRRGGFDLFDIFD